MTTRTLLLVLVLGAACSHQKPPEVATNSERTAAVSPEAKPESGTKAPEPETRPSSEKAVEPPAADAAAAPGNGGTAEKAEAEKAVEVGTEKGEVKLAEKADEKGTEKADDKPSEPPTTEPSPSPEKDKALETEESEKPSPKGDLTLQKMSLTNQIVDRLPDETRTDWVIGRDAEFLVWMEWKNSGPEVSLETVWKQDGKEKWRFPFQVGSGKTWRTWVKRRVNKKDAGAWTVQVVDASGHVYRSIRFRISGP